MIIGDDVIAELMRYGQMADDGCWGIGDITSQLAKSSAPLAEVYGTVAFYCGRAKRTVREYRLVCEFYPSEVRQEYQSLSFAHFRIAKRLDDWRAALEWAASECAPVDAMVEKFSPAVVAEDGDVVRLLNKIKLLVKNMPMAGEIYRLLDEIERLIEQ